jgi:hypothetical protein
VPKVFSAMDSPVIPLPTLKKAKLQGYAGKVPL